MEKDREQGEGRWIRVIARIRTDFPTKFGIPHQSSRNDALRAQIIFEPEYRNPEAVRGLEEFTHLWIVWEFSEAVRDTWSPTVRPPKLGGNVRKGVFATRSPFRPNPIGLSSVKIERVEMDPELGPVIHVAGADMMDGTPVYDLKPYLPYVDSHPEASGGFTDWITYKKLQVVFPEQWLSMIPVEYREALIGVLEGDPRPGYQKDPNRIYGLAFRKWDIHFRVEGEILTVCGITDYKG